MRAEKAIGLEIRTLANLIKRHVNHLLLQTDIDAFTAMHGWIIGYIEAHSDRDVFQRDLETEFSIRRSTATGILQLMEKKGLIQRVPVCYDARLKKLVVTETARTVHQQIVVEVDKTEEDLKKDLTAEEIEQFFAIMAKLRKNIED